MLPWSRRGTLANSHPSTPLWLAALAIAVFGASACAGTQLRSSVRELRARADQARDNGALRCAPRELALAEANTEFADKELDQGDYLRAREHVGVAEDKLEEAIRLSPRDRCVAPARPADRDGDGINDGDDRCPAEAEDKDGFEDGDGCPDPDNDKDGVVDGDDKCPIEPGPGDNAGCPKKYQHIVVTEEKIELKQKIFFETDKAVIMSRSFGLLSEIANVLQSRATMRVRIEGHTDARGTAKHNLVLSQGRADAVRMHLVGLGVDGDRLDAQGFGSEQPIETNKTAAGRERNRRVEFVITTQ